MTEEENPVAHRAILAFRQGQIAGRELLEQLLAGKLVVPMSEPPRIEYAKITGWRPATVSKADGSRWLVAFTTSAMASAFGDVETEYSFYMNVDTRWVLETVPDEWGIVINLRTPDMFEWNPKGLAKFRRDFLGDPPAAQGDG